MSASSQVADNGKLSGTNGYGAGWKNVPTPTNLPIRK